MPPWLGIVTEIPSVNVAPGGWDNIRNFFAVRGRLQTRPRLESFGTAPDGQTIYFLQSFKDINDSWHTLVLTTKTAYFLTESGGSPVFNALNYPSGITTLGDVDRPFGASVLLNRIYFSNGGEKVLYTDGSATLKLAGDVPGGARFIAVIGSSLISAYLHENSRLYPTSVRWSVIGNPNSYLQFTSGVNTLIEVPDEITGIVGTSRSGYVFRTNGFTAITPTGRGVAPLAFEHFSTEIEGIGNRFPYALAAYSENIILAADDDIYLFNFPSFTPIGGGARRDIFADLALATGPVIGKIIPGLGVGYEFLSYWLTIPKASDTVSWVMALNERHWTRFDGDGALTALSTVYIN